MAKMKHEFYRRCRVFEGYRFTREIFYFYPDMSNVSIFNGHVMNVIEVVLAV
jgi:hypothetical protein